MKGYSLIMPQEDSITFSGILNSGQKTIDVQKNSTGWNLVGNPYPCAVNWAVETGWDKTDIQNSIHLWNGDAQVYETFTITKYGTFSTKEATGIIPAEQGFFVVANSNTSLQVNNEAKLHNTEENFHKSETTVPNIKISATNSKSYDEAIVYFAEDATEGFDSELDINKIFSFAQEIPSLYFKSADYQNLVINAMPEITEDMVVPMSFYCSNNTVANLKFDEINDISEYVYLKDLKENTFQEITENSEYSFVYNTEDATDRFEIIFKSTMLSNEELSSSSEILTYAENKNIHVVSNDDFVAQNPVVEIYSVNGAKIIQQTLTSTNQTFDMNMYSTGVYVVTIRTTDNVETKKVILK